MNAEIVYSFFIVSSDPGKVGLVEMLLEQLNSVLENLLWVIFVKCSEEFDDVFFLRLIE